MNIAKIYRRRSFGVILLFMLLIGAALSTAGYYGLDRYLPLLSSADGQSMITGAVPQLVELLKLGFANYYNWVIPVIAGVFVVLAIISWAVLAIFVSPVLKAPASEPKSDPVKKSGKKDFIDHKVEQERKRRLFLHALSVLQREGRLLDFFDEDLNLYEDEQIGAAVRSIQEDCKKAIKKYIDLKPVVKGEEGDSITIEDGFDIDAINLVGNVSGQPPFEGIIKHPGWKAGKKDVPKLSDIQDPGIMTPAEIEVQ